MPLLANAQAVQLPRPILKDLSRLDEHYEKMSAWFCSIPQFNLDSSFYYLNQWEQHTLKHSPTDYAKLSRINLEWAKIYKNFQYFNKAKSKVLIAQKYFDKIKDQKKEVLLGAELYYVLSIALLKSGEEKKALFYFLKQDSLLLNRKDEISKALFLYHKADFNFGYAQGDKDLAVKLFNECMPLLKKQGKFVAVARNYMILSSVLKSENRLAECQAMRDSLQKYAEIAGNPYLLTYNPIEDAYVQIVDSQYTDAKKRILKVIAEMKKYGLDKTNFYQNALQDLGEIAWKNKEFDLAIQYYKECFEIATSLEMVHMQLSLLEILSYIYNDKQDYKTALSYLNQYKELNLQYLQEKADRSSAEHELEIALANKELQLEKNRTFSNTLLAGLVLLILGTFFVIYNYRKQNKLNALLQNNVQQKEVLLKEIHHRVKNNLSVISGLLELQSYSIKNEAIEQTFKESQNRVKSIALIHQRLYQHENLASIELKEYTDDLYKQIHNVFNKSDQKVVFTNKVEKTLLDIDTAVSLGLIINELLTNSFKYAFKPELKGEIEIELLKLNEGSYQLIYRDNGNGLPAGFDFKKVNSFGLRLVSRLCKQLFGKITFTKSNGYSAFIIDFKDKIGKFKEEQDNE
mgnify:FL=1